MVTKQQQLEWLAENCHNFNDHQLLMSINRLGKDAFDTDYQDFHLVTKKDWQQERDKMQKQAAQAAQPAPDNAWHERGEFPPAGCECEVLHRGKWIKTVIIGMSPYKSCVYSLIGSGSDYAYNGIANSHFFRPLRTEREKAIDEMILAIDHIKEGNFETFIGALYDAGYRKVNP